MKPKTNLSESWPFLQSRTCTYDELMRMSTDYAHIDPMRSLGLMAILLGHRTKIQNYFNGDTGKAKFWSPSLHVADITLIVDEDTINGEINYHSLQKVQRPPVVSRQVVKKLPDFNFRHLN